MKWIYDERKRDSCVNDRQPLFCAFKKNNHIKQNELCVSQRDDTEFSLSRGGRCTRDKNQNKTSLHKNQWTHNKRSLFRLQVIPARSEAFLFFASATTIYRTSSHTNIFFNIQHSLNSNLNVSRNPSACIESARQTQIQWDRRRYTESDITTPHTDAFIVAFSSCFCLQLICRWHK